MKSYEPRFEKEEHSWWGEMQKKIADLQLNALEATPSRKLTFSLAAMFADEFNISQTNEWVMKLIRENENYYLNERAKDTVGDKLTLGDKFIVFPPGRDDQ